MRATSISPHNTVEPNSQLNSFYWVVKYAGIALLMSTLMYLSGCDGGTFKKEGSPKTIKVEGQVQVLCECTWKVGPDYCEIGLEVDSYNWVESANSNDSIDWNEEFLQDFCHRKKQPPCMCGKEERFSGQLQ